MSTLEHPRPEGLLHNAAFSQVVVAAGTRTIYTAGQVAIDEVGATVGVDDLAAQTAFRDGRPWSWRGAGARRSQACGPAQVPPTNGLPGKPGGSI